MRTDLYPTRRSAHSTYIDRVDPVVWGSGPLPEGLTEEDVRRFEEDGILVLEDIFSQEEIEEATRELDRLRQAAETLDPETVIGEETADSVVRSIFKVHTQSEVFARMAEHPRLRAIVEYLLGDEVYVMQSRVNNKPAFEGGSFDWHSDFETWHAEDGMPRMHALSASIFLSENTELNGPTMFIPGSHKTFVACPGETPEDNYKSSLKKQRIGVPSKEAITELSAERGIVAPSGRPGTVVLFDCNTLHASVNNMTPWARANAFFVFNAVSNALQDPFDSTKRRPHFLAEEPDYVRERALRQAA